ncbi:MAG: hypothetical protein H0X36_11105 [Sphingomonadaceae bacterium]|nr:hypothetical protein [Sphingomonadaceae bacterium]
MAPGGTRNGPRRDPGLIKLIIKAHAARAALMSASNLAVEEIATREGHGRDYLGVLLRLSWLSPDITSAILDGHQPAEMTRQALARKAGVPLGWVGQRAIFFRVPRIER